MSKLKRSFNLLAPSHEFFWILPYSVFIGGVLGSPHCVSMCGPLTLSYSNKKANLAGFQLGRLFSYVCIGAALGSFGNLILGQSRPEWLSNFGIILIAFLLFVNAWRLWTDQSLHFNLPAFFPKVFARISARPFASKFNRYLNQNILKLWQNLRSSNLPSQTTSVLSGLLTVLLPCGHLYSFLIGALATGSALRGGLFMFAFWLGNAPILFLGGTLFHKLAKPNFQKRKRWAGAILLVSGLISVLAFGARTQSFNQELKSSKPNLNCHEVK